MMDITQSSADGGDSETTYRNTIAFTMKNYKNAILLLGGGGGNPFCFSKNAIGYSSRNMQLHHNKNVSLAEPHICWAHIEDWSLNIYRREKMLRTEVAGQNETHSPSVLRC
jgi:hypothetical protein